MKAFDGIFNLGNILISNLLKANIDTIEQLKKIEVEGVFLKLKNINSKACINMLYILEGAIQGICWHSLSPERKAELKLYFIKCQYIKNS